MKNYRKAQTFGQKSSQTTKAAIKRETILTASPLTTAHDEKREPQPLSTINKILIFKNQILEGLQ